MSGARIVGIEYALPEGTVTSDELASRHPKWGMPEVAKRTGVKTRHIAAASETALDLARSACEQLLDRTGVDRSSISALMFCTQTPDYVMPPNACLLQAQLRLPQSVAAFDYSLACSGYVYGLWLARSLIGSGAVEQVLLVTGDTYSKLINPGDRGTVTLFGDGASATLIRRDERAGLGEFVLGTDGSRGALFEVPAGGARLPRSAETTVEVLDSSGNVRTAEQIHMDGAGILAFVKRDVPASIRDLLERGGVAASDVDLVVLHQASRMSADYLQAVLPFPRDRYFNNIEHVGNTVSSSIPMCLRDAESTGALKAGDTVVLAGFGVGLSWAACLLTW